MSDMNEQEYMQSGLEALQTGDLNAAQVFFKQAIRVNSANEDAWLSLAKTYPDEPDKARKCYENVLKINPLNAEAKTMLDQLPVETPAAETAEAMQTGPAAAAEANALRQEAAAQHRTSYGGPDMAAPKGIEGAPEKVNADYFADFFQRAFKSSSAVLTGQSDGSAELPTSWWNATLLVVTVGLITGLFRFLTGVRLSNVLTVVTVPPLTILVALAAFGAGAFLSHWYLRTYRGGTASLLDHTMTYARIWFPVSLVIALIGLIAGLTGDFVMDLNVFLRTFNFSAGGLGLILWIISVVVVAYSAILLHRHWGRLYPNTPSTGLWIGVLIALAVTGILF